VLLRLRECGFQDLFTYDFRRTEMCVIPYGTQEGEISFCAYNTGVGWRQIIEEMHKTASLPSGTKRTDVMRCMRKVSGSGNWEDALAVVAGDRQGLEEDIDRPAATPYLVDEKESVGA
jgi:hypothetical protein